MEGHDERAAELEYELADLEKQQEKLDDSIHAAQDDWEATKRDASVPGAGTGEESEEGEGSPAVDDEKS